MTLPTVEKDRQRTDLNHRQRQEDIDTARKQIKNAFQATLFIGGMTTLFWLASMSGTKASNVSSWLIFDVVFIFGMGYGIFRNSEICAKLMLGYFILSKILQVASGQFPILGIFMAGLMIRFLWEGVVGTTSYNQLLLLQEELESPQFVARTYDEYRSEDLESEEESPLATTTSVLQPLAPTAELLELCGGDRSQAQWLLSKIKAKNPQESADWCNQQAIEQLRK
jgi:hypothetical protein